MANAVDAYTNIMKNTNSQTANMLDPEVLMSMINAKLSQKILITPFAKVDNTLEGRPGTTVTIPKWEYVGPASVVAEGDAIPKKKLNYGTAQYTVQKIGQGVSLTDEAMLSGYGDPVGAAGNQLALAIADKVEDDVFKTAIGATKYVYDSKAIISYAGIVNALDLFDEEEDSEKVMFIAPHQLTQLRLDPNFISADKYDNKVIMNGEVGKIAGVRIIRSKRVEANIKTGNYLCPILKLNQDNETEDELAAITVYMKRSVSLETARDAEHEITTYFANEHYVAALTNDSKVVVAKFLKVAA